MAISPVSFNNTPQAVDDSFSAALTGLTEDSTNTILLAVMANDLGGQAKTLYSLDDGIENEGSTTSADLLVKDIVGVNSLSQYGATIAIRADGKVAYSMTAASRAHFASLGEGEIGHDTFTYAIRLGNGTLSWATATVEIKGVNDAAQISGATNAAVAEDDAPNTTSGTLSSSDVDNSDNVFQASSGNGDNGYGSFAVDAAGNWTYTLNNGNQAVDALNVGDSLSDSFTVLSEDGTTQLVSITINGTNDAALISGDTGGAVAEDDAPNTASGSLSASDVDNPDNLFQANNGNADNGYGSFAVDAAGNWTYTLDNGNPAVDALNVGDSLSDSFTVLAEDGTAQLISITINGSNDAAVLSSDSVELDESNAPLSTSGQLTISDVDSPATFVAQPDTVGSYGSFSIDAVGAWTYTADSAHDEFVDGQTYTDTFAVFSADGTETSVTINILGTNDAAVLSADVANLSETNDAADISTSGTLTISDVDSPATFVAQPGTVGSYGSFSIDAVGAWTYTADSAHNEFVDGQTYTDTFDVVSADGTHTSVTINILGTNDAAELSSDSVELDESNAPLSTSGQLTISDVDSPATFQAQSNTAGSHGSFSIDAAGAWSYTADSAFDELNVGDSLTDSFSVFSADGTETEVSVTINGTNDAAVISGDVSGTVTEDDAPNTATGTLSASDVDNDDNLFQANSGNGNNSYGSFAVDAAGSWTYTLDNGNPAVNALNAGDSLSDSFTVLSADGTAQLVSITINGTSSAPQVNATGTLSYSENQTASVINSSLTLADTDSPNLSGAQVSLSGNFHAGEDVLGFSNQNGITGSYNAVTGVLTLSGTASVANYQEALRSVTYFNASESPSGDTRTISFQVDDGALLSNIATSSVAVTPVDDGHSIIANSQVNYSTSNSPEVAFISGFSFQDADSGSNTVTVTINSNIVGDALNVLAGSGVTVAGAGTSVLTLTGMLEDINAFISSDHIKWNPLGNNTSPSQDFTISIDDNGVLAGGNLASRTLRYAFTQTNSLGLDNNVNLVSFAGWSLNALSASAGNGSDTITTTWHNGPSATAVSYVGGQPTSTPGDSITLAFTAGQLEEVLGNTTFRAALAGYLDGTPSGATLNLDTASWNATVSGFESANLALASGNDGIVTYAAVGSTLPSFLAGLTGNAGDNLLVGTAAGENLSGSSGNDILVGLDGNDLLLGGIGADLLLGGAGNDELTGGTGNDILAGGNGADSFEFGETGALNVDAVIDYSYVEGDTLDLSALLDSNFDFGAGSQVADFVQLVQAGSSITVQVDSDGAANGASFADVAVLTNYGTSGSDLVNTWFGNVEQTLTV
jgi:VCBS repeat-containing protein